ncbi:C-terminal binding protein [Bosea sp. 124]|uniref:C-terminal binding protein n=1 Tax=Bosea sp. 124 TaxID=2135642 RepID=UPI001AECE4E5|nr:C-terminal binding protein [Bosea sp. 124]
MSAQYVVKVADCDHGSIDIERGVLREACPSLPWLNCRTEDAVIAQCADTEALLIMYAPLTRRVLGHLTSCKSIVRYGVGVDTIDLRAAADLGIIVSNVPDYGTQEVADHALALMMCLTRKIVRANAQVKRGEWDFRQMRPVHRLQVQTAGLIGMGRIGQAMAHKVHALGMRVIAFDPAAAPEHVPDYVEMVGLEELLRASDVVSVHCPLTERTRNLLSEDRLRLMKPIAYLVNTARGNLVDEAALDRLLSEGRLAGAGFDVFGIEPPPADYPLLRHETFICSPHMAWHSDEAERDLKRSAAEEALRVLRGEPPKYQVNRF